MLIGLEAGLYILVGPSCAGKSTFIAVHELQNNVVSTDALRIELTYDMRRQDKNEEVFAEFHRRIEAKLRVGQRVFADATHLNAKDRKATAEIAKRVGVPVTYVVFNRPMADKNRTAGWRADVRIKGKSLIETHEESFVGAEKAILAGDGDKSIRVIDTRTDKVEVVQRLPREALLASHRIMLMGYEGLCAIGDVHGNLDGLEKALAYADKHKLFPVFLGDVVDYGADSLTVMEIVADLVFRGLAIMVLGNHEKKVAKFLRDRRTEKGYKGTLSDSNKVTTDQFDGIRPEEARIMAENRFLSLVDNCPSWQEIGSHIFAHGAVTQSMFYNTLFRASKNSIEETFSNYGQTTGENGDDGYPVRLYTWIDSDILEGRTAVVGHAVRSWTDPLVVMNQRGGTAIFMDTGSSKASRDDPTIKGRLSWADIRFTKNGVLEKPTFLHENMF